MFLSKFSLKEFSFLVIFILVSVFCFLSLRHIILGNCGNKNNFYLLPKEDRKSQSDFPITDECKKLLARRFDLKEGLT